ncbi:DUF6193 family natural product biosynthesis protein [Asanoa siamensis]|uniref:Uncharacterized protein n=1 Tax=Asanoa siamensis TaxID=926357 RepID=A0ABQ4CZR0_9ACTN|nr:DUF6193 family natural product biosynthesis protein [Asanoa siamensis]GIF76746.1 hypothetical protein Asi02nite_62640 [Asanoa siamensis]
MAADAYPDPADLFPDVAAAGGLADVLRAAARARGLDLDVVGDEIAHAEVPTEAGGRAPLRVSAYTWERTWSMSGSGRGGGTKSRLLLTGATGDLGSIAVVAHAWQRGRSLAEIASLAPFVALTGHLEVPDGSVAQAIASQWAYLRAGAERSDWPEYRELIETAFARPELRALYAFTSHWTLRLQADDTLEQFDLVCLDAPHDGGPFTVRTRWSGALVGETATAAEAVAVAVAHLPAAQLVRFREAAAGDGS